MTTDQLHNQLIALCAERAAARLQGSHDRPYLDALLAEIETTERAFVGAAVIEIAALRAELGAPLVG